jgi:hypothetical protein
MGHATFVNRSSCASDCSKCILYTYSHTDLNTYSNAESNGHPYPYTDSNGNSNKYRNTNGNTCAWINSIQLGYADPHPESYTLY